jgi:UDP-4-amino-4,6-dideoxy-N-acetyl-beta-L-altrosamine N-acetyltransferase
MFDFKKLQEEDLALVLKWRLKPSVSKYLFTEIDNDLEKQKNWFKRVSQDPTYRYWIIYYQKKPVGLFNFCNLDVTNKRTNAGYYIGEEEYNQIGGLILPYFYNYAFKNLELNKIYGEVVDGNTILKTHLAHGYKLVGTHKEHLFKNNSYHDVHVIELMAKDWLAQKRYQNFNYNLD